MNPNLMETADRARPVATHEIRGGGGLRLHAREWGNPDGRELLFIHGLSQCDLCWTKQVNGELASRFRIVTFDLRGHGLSEQPSAPEHYADARLWADDLAAVMDQTALDRPVLVAWSYGGYVVADFVRAYGEERIAGINLVGGGVVLKPPSFDHIGPGLLENAQEMCASDLDTNIAAIQRFVRACTAQPLDEEEWITALCWNVGGTIRSSCPRWPSTRLASARRPFRPGTTVSGTCRSGRRRSALTGSSAGLSISR
jgi:non-heme chloroperoxidase